MKLRILRLGKDVKDYWLLYGMILVLSIVTGLARYDPRLASAIFPMPSAIMILLFILFIFHMY